MRTTITNAKLIGYCSEAGLAAIRQTIRYFHSLSGANQLQLVDNLVPPSPSSADPDQGADLSPDQLLNAGIPCAAPWALYGSYTLDESAFWEMYQLTERLMNAALADTTPVAGPAMRCV